MADADVADADVADADVADDDDDDADALPVAAGDELLGATDAAVDAAGPGDVKRAPGSG